MTPNEIREKVNQLGDPALLLCQRILDCWLDDYLRDEEWLIDVDCHASMAHDVRVFQHELGNLAFSGDFRGSGGDKF